jgi:ketosteroid isomerase-like protein
MTTREVAERLTRELHAARVKGDLAAMCRLFTEQGEFRIAGASADKPIAISSHGLAGFRPWLAMLVKVFRITNYERLSFLFEGSRASVHWRADIHSKITGVTVATELVDLVQFQDDHIVKYCEFFVPQSDRPHDPSRASAN